MQKVFVELYKKGLIYRGKRMVNWCPAPPTALSDEEVVMKEQKGSLYYFKVVEMTCDCRTGQTDTAPDETFVVDRLATHRGRKPFPAIPPWP